MTRPAGWTHRPESKAKIRAARLGKKHRVLARIKMTDVVSGRDRRGPKNPCWRGGVSRKYKAKQRSA
jgi:hypothetical protein